MKAMIMMRSQIQEVSYIDISIEQVYNTVGRASIDPVYYTVDRANILNNKVQLNQAPSTMLKDRASFRK